MNKGFYTALGTPLDEMGNLVVNSMRYQVRRQIEAKASGLLCMGSMGNMIGIKDNEYYHVARTCEVENNRELPLMIGVMDNSIIRVMNRVEVLKGLKIEGVVATTPYYYRVNQEQIINFYEAVASQSSFPVFMYDLPSVTQSPLTTETVIKLMKHPNIRGLKTANLNLITEIMRGDTEDRQFGMFYSGLDTFDVALKAGIEKNLDGMFSCTPVNSEKMYYSGSPSFYLKNILELRNLFVKYGVLNSFSFAMEQIGCPGIYHEDYTRTINETARQEIKNQMIEIGEI